MSTLGESSTLSAVILNPNVSDLEILLTSTEADTEICPNIKQSEIFEITKVFIDL